MIQGLLTKTGIKKTKCCEPTRGLNTEKSFYINEICIYLFITMIEYDYLYPY